MLRLLEVAAELQPNSVRIYSCYTCRDICSATIWMEALRRTGGPIWRSRRDSNASDIFVWGDLIVVAHSPAAAHQCLDILDELGLLCQ